VTSDSETTVRESQQTETDLDGLFRLILLDDADHSYPYVIEMLGAIFGYGREKAFAIASVVDSSGEAVVETAAHDRVRDHQRRIHSFGPDPRIERCLGSMSAIVEQAP
jgi:ATP-dependent Clp protease adaptor protein ClpS